MNKLFGLALLASSLASGLVACGSDDACDPDAPNTICTIVGNGEQGLNNAKRALDTNLYVPQDTAVSPDGEVWVLDFNNYLVRAVDKDGGIRTVIGTGEVGDSPPPELQSMPAIEALFNHTTDLFFHDGYLYLASWHNSRVKRVRLSDMMIENYAGLGKRTYYYGDEGPALDAALDLPSSIALDPTGNIVIMDQANQVIRMVDQNNIIHRIAGKCVIDLDSPCAAGVQPQLCPGSDKYACGDLATECSKPCTPGLVGDGGDALEARMAQPFGQQADPAGRIVYDAAGNLIFADTDNNRIRKVDTAGIMTTIAGTGVAGYAGDDGPATQAQINRPVDVAAAPDGSIYFTDVYNSCVRKIDPAGIITRVVGQCSSDPDLRGFAGDGGPPLEAKLDRPYGIDLVGTKLYVSDSYNNRIRVVNLVE
ncbi:MAG TPA: hypothetical protein VFQ53_40695 [Kofleriaceae bacterium]|nr:hypothetical protein [Kofleriaceae bacterium]